MRPRPGSPTGNAYLGLGLRWPRFLRGALPRQVAFLCIGTAAASFAGMPKWTALMLLALVAKIPRHSVHSCKEIDVLLYREVVV